MPKASFFGKSYVHNNSYVGSFTYGTDCIINNTRIGKFCSIAPGCKIGLNEHPTHLVSTHPLTYNADLYNKNLSATNIGHDVWIGANCVIKSGVSIGDGCVIAAGAVVVKDCPPFSIIGGVPAREIGQRKSNREFIDAITDTNELSELEEIARSFRRSQSIVDYENE